MHESLLDPHTVLGISIEATAEEVRSAYLDLVRQYPPDRSADKFRQIHAAYQMLCDPLIQADALLSPNRDRPDLAKVIEEAEAESYRLPKLVLLALGNS